MSKRTALESLVLDDWDAGSPAHLLFSGLTAGLSADAIDYLSLPVLRKVAGLDINLSELERLAEYFAGERLALLETHYEFIRADDTSEEIEPAIIHDALMTGEFHDPNTGELVPDWTECVCVFFSGTSRLRDAIEDRADE